MPLLTLSMAGQPLPPPAQPVTDPTPQEQYEQEMQNKQAKAQAHEAEAVRSRGEATKQETGFFGKVGAFAKAAGESAQKAATEAHASGEAALRKQMDERDHARFVEKFVDICSATTPPQQLISCNGCKAMHQGKSVPGEAFLCSTHLCFSGEMKTEAGVQPIKDAIPIQSIASLQPSVVLPTSASGRGDQSGCLEDGPPFIIPVPAASVVPTCIQVFTVDGRIIQLYEFDNKAVKAGALVTSSISGNAWGRFYNWLDHTWRTAVPDGRHAGATYR